MVLNLPQAAARGREGDLCQKPVADLVTQALHTRVLALSSQNEPTLQNFLCRAPARARSIRQSHYVHTLNYMQGGQWPWTQRATAGATCTPHHPSPPPLPMHEDTHHPLLYSIAHTCSTPPPTRITFYSIRLHSLVPHHRHHHRPPSRTPPPLLLPPLLRSAFGSTPSCCAVARRWQRHGGPPRGRSRCCCRRRARARSTSSGSSTPSTFSGPVGGGGYEGGGNVSCGAWPWVSVRWMAKVVVE